MRRVCLSLFTLHEIHVANEFARPASASLNHWTIGLFPHLAGFLIRESGLVC